MTPTATKHKAQEVPATIKFWETEQRRPSEKMVEKLRHL
jgi:hypothetical protein